jgi:hypothetical protein
VGKATRLAAQVVRIGFGEDRLGYDATYPRGSEDSKALEAAALEAYPIDTSAPKSSSNIFVGTASFVRAGFKEVARRASARPIMRRDLEATAQ